MYNLNVSSIKISGSKELLHYMNCLIERYSSAFQLILEGQQNPWYQYPKNFNTTKKIVKLLIQHEYKGIK